jgi:hypothetical protein
MMAENRGDMKKIKTCLLDLLLLGIFSLSPAPLFAVEGIVMGSVTSTESNYCHLRFPAIRPETLYSDRPVLKDPSDGDIIDFYGPCDYDPLGKEQIRRQRLDLHRERSRPGD